MAVTASSAGSIQCAWALALFRSRVHSYCYATLRIRVRSTVACKPAGTDSRSSDNFEHFNLACEANKMYMKEEAAAFVLVYSIYYTEGLILVAVLLDCIYQPCHHPVILLLYASSFAQNVKPVEVMVFLNKLFSLFDRLTDVHGVHKVGLQEAAKQVVGFRGYHL
eukprot:1159890-Pelagomonas_calceolata.AAC.4